MKSKEKTELKTLKDFLKFRGRYIEEEELKVEAIKWAKSFKKELNREDLRMLSAFMFIKDFFNLTEEDLK